MKNKFIKFFALIFAIIISISCGNEITPPENDNEIGTVIVIDTSKTYTVRLGSIVTNIKPSDMNNAWKYYIGGKKVLKPDKTDAGWYFDKETGNYHEPPYYSTNPRADFIGTAIMSNHGEAYLMGIYYNNRILGEGFSQYMLIYIQADGQERGYYGGGSDKNKKPDYSTVWTHYKASMGVDPLGILSDKYSKDPDPAPETTPEPDPKPAKKEGDLSLILGKFQNKSYKGEWIETGEDYDLNVFYSYSMKVLETNWISETECYLYGQYTATAYQLYYDMGFEDEDIESMGVTINTGKYYAIHIKNLSSTSYEYSGALKNGVYAASTLEEAKTWTVESGWFNVHSKLDKVLTKSSFMALNINAIDIKEVVKIL